MPLIESITDLFAAGAHWTVAAAEMGQTSTTSPEEALVNRFGETLAAAREVVAGFISLVRRAFRSAKQIQRGEVVTPGQIPLVPLPGINEQFVTQGIVTLTATDLGTPDDPFQTTVPFQVPTPTVPTLEELATTIQENIEQLDARRYPLDPQHEKAKEKATYIRTASAETTVDINPFFIFRVS